MNQITKYLRGALIALFVFLGFGFKHFKDKAYQQKKELAAERRRNKKQLDQIKTHLEREQAAREEIKKAESDSYNNRDYFK